MADQKGQASTPAQRTRVEPNRYQRRPTHSRNGKSGGGQGFPAVVVNEGVDQHRGAAM